MSKESGTIHNVINICEGICPVSSLSLWHFPLACSQSLRINHVHSYIIYIWKLFNVTKTSIRPWTFVWILLHDRTAAQMKKNEFVIRHWLAFFWSLWGQQLNIRHFTTDGIKLSVCSVLFSAFYFRYCEKCPKGSGQTVLSFDVSFVNMVLLHSRWLGCRSN